MEHRLGPESLRLLLVEDNLGDAHLVAEHISQIESPHLELIHVERITDALDLLTRDDAIDAVLLDLGLPDSSGVDSVRKLHDTRPDIPIVVLTGLDSDDVGIMAVQEGAEDYVIKGALDGHGITRSVLYAIERSRLKEQVRLIVTRNVDAMVVVGGDQIVRYVNRAAQDLFGADLIGSGFGYSLTVKSTSEIEISGPDGESRFCEMRVARIVWDGELAYLASIRDITDLRRAREFEGQLMRASRLASIGQLAAGVAHEINNPVTFVQANLTLLRGSLEAMSGRLDRVRGQLAGSSGDERDVFDALIDQPALAAAIADARQLLDDCDLGVERIASITRDLSTFSRIERDDTEVFDINEAVDVACQMTINELRHRATLERSLGAGLVVHGDRAKLTQVFVNLLINAAQAVDAVDGTRDRVRVETHREDEWVVVAISDTGCGIAADQIDRLFEPFYTTKPLGEGTGLGLSISAETVHKHNGQIDVTSELGVGARFEVRLPASRTRAPEAAPPTAATPVSERRRVLLIDDDAVVLRALRRMISLRHEVVAAAGGSEALALLERDREFDVIICDMMMPDIDGPGVHAALVDKWPDLAGRMFFVTGGMFSASTQRFVEEHELVVLQKPVAMAVLLETIASIGDGQER